jgi:hypothetical protein
MPPDPVAPPVPVPVLVPVLVLVLVVGAPPCPVVSAPPDPGDVLPEVLVVPSDTPPLQAASGAASQAAPRRARIRAPSRR